MTTNKQRKQSSSSRNERATRAYARGHGLAVVGPLAAMTEIRITIVTVQDAEIAEPRLRAAIARAGFDISDFVVKAAE